MNLARNKELHKIGKNDPKFIATTKIRPKVYRSNKNTAQYPSNKNKSVRNDKSNILFGAIYFEFRFVICLSIVKALAKQLQAEKKETKSFTLK